MNKKKSQEYLNKINESFSALAEHPYEIEIDSLLGYVRIFYSSLKDLPVQSKAKPVVAAIPEPVSASEANEIKISSPEINFEAENDLLNEKETIVVNDAVADTPIHPDIEAIEHKVTVAESPVDNQYTDEIAAEEVIEAPAAEPLKQAFEIIEEVVEEPIPAATEIIEPEIETKAEPLHTSVSDEIIVERDTQPINKWEPAQSESSNIEEDHTISRNHPPYSPPVSIQESAIEIIESAPLTKTYEAEKVESVADLYRPSVAEQYDNENDAIENLFRDKSPTGLVDFLSLSPLDNLNKAWGLNDKMLIIKDLFNNDLQAFESAIDAINRTTSMKEAKTYLIENVVRKYEWHDLSKIKRASNFIMQTKRLFVDK